MPSVGQGNMDVKLLTNKTIGDMYKASIARWFANEDNLRTFCAECATMTDNNFHTERQIKIAHKFGFKELERKLKNLDAVHTDMGYLSDDLLHYRNELSKCITGKIAWLYGQELADIINLA